MDIHFSSSQSSTSNTPCQCRFPGLWPRHLPSPSLARAPLNLGMPLAARRQMQCKHPHPAADRIIQATREIRVQNVKKKECHRIHRPAKEGVSVSRPVTAFWPPHSWQTVAAPARHVAVASLLPWRMRPSLITARPGAAETKTHPRGLCRWTGRGLGWNDGTGLGRAPGGLLSFPGRGFFSPLACACSDSPRLTTPPFSSPWGPQLGPTPPHEPWSSFINPSF